MLHLVKKSVTPNQIAAMCSLVWNIGSHAFAGSTLLKRLNAGDYQGAADAFTMWVKAGGKVVEGLQRRRLAEKLVFMGPAQLTAGTPAGTPSG